MTTHGGEEHGHAPRLPTPQRGARTTARATYGRFTLYYRTSLVGEIVTIRETMEELTWYRRRDLPRTKWDSLAQSFPTMEEAASRAVASARWLPVPRAASFCPDCGLALTGDRAEHRSIHVVPPAHSARS